MTELVRAKRLGWDETDDGVTSTDILDPYDYTDDDLEGELVKIDVNTPYLKYTNYIVNGQVADPSTIEKITKEDAIAADAFGSPNQARDGNGRWSRGGTISGGGANTHAREHTPTPDVTTNNEQEALSSYTSRRYADINNGLRSNNGNTKMLPEETHTYVKNLDSMFAKAKPLTKHIGVHRGMNNSNEILGTMDPKKLKGKVITDHGFVSTSTDEYVTHNFVYDSEFPATFNITVPAGKKVIDVDTALGAHRMEDTEQEILLPRNTSIRITNVTQTGSAEYEDQGLIIDAEVI